MGTSKELARLRKENEILRQEREILKRAANFSPRREVDDFQHHRCGEEGIPRAAPLQRSRRQPKTAGDPWRAKHFTRWVHQEIFPSTGRPLGECRLWYELSIKRREYLSLKDKKRKRSEPGGSDAIT